MRLSFFFTLLFLECALAWGPITHQTLTYNEGTYSFLDSYSFRLGTYSPDAFTSIEWDFHTLDYAGYQYQFALEYNSTVTSNIFDPILWSLGFGTHLANDLIGFHTGGWLYDNSTFYEVFYSTDTYRYINYKSELDYVYFSPAISEVSAFVAAASEYYAGISSGFVAATQDQVESCCSDYDAYSKLLQKMVIADESTYQQQLISADPYAPDDWATCESQLDMQLSCCQILAEYWLDSIMDGASPDDLMERSWSYADSLYAAGVCEPLS